MPLHFFLFLSLGPIHFEIFIEPKWFSFVCINLCYSVGVLGPMTIIKYTHITLHTYIYIYIYQFTWHAFQIYLFQVYFNCNEFEFRSVRCIHAKSLDQRMYYFFFVSYFVNFIIDPKYILCGEMTRWTWERKKTTAEKK